MGLQAGEKLVSELAASRVGTDLKPTDDQQELNIPRFLVYLAGIVIAEDEYDQWKDQTTALNTNGSTLHSSPARERRFAEFQKQYWAFVKDASVHTEEQKSWISSCLASKPYKLTTRVFPSAEQQAIIIRDLLKECEKMENLSNAALEALLKEESSSTLQDTPKKKRRAGRKKTKNHNDKKRPIVCESLSTPRLESEEDGGKMGTLEAVVATTVSHSPVESTAEENSWVEIKRKEDTRAATKSPHTRNDEIRDIDSSLLGPFMIPGVIKNESGSSTIADKKNHNHAYDSESGSDKGNDASVEGPGCPTGKTRTNVDIIPSPLAVQPNKPFRSRTDSHSEGLHDAPTSESRVTKQLQRIAKLEKDVSNANQQLTEERLEHSKIMRKEKQRYENLIQALQLRLYISENKLRTFEEALENHVQAVSTISSSSSSISRTNGDGRMPSSPSLISKVLEKNKEKGNGKDCFW